MSKDGEVICCSNCLTWYRGSKCPKCGRAFDPNSRTCHRVRILRVNGNRSYLVKEYTTLKPESSIREEVRALEVKTGKRYRCQFAKLNYASGGVETFAQIVYR